MSQTKNAYHAMLMPVFWDIFKNNYLISVPHFQMQILKKLHLRVSAVDVREFFKEMEKIGYGEFVLHHVNRGSARLNHVWSEETRAFKCRMRTEETTVSTVIKCSKQIPGGKK